MDEVKLLPCPMPWCAKSKPELMQGGFKNGSFVVRCKTCGCETPRFYDPRFAISKWNTRAALTRPPIVTDEVVERVKLEFYRDYPLSVGYGLSENGRDYAVRDEHFRAAADEFADRLIAAMPTIPQSLGAIPGSHPADQAPSGLGASRFDPERVERVARAIAAGKRDPRTPPEEIDRVWTAYCGQARAALAADDSALANENADLIHDLERQMTIANIECNVAESARDALRQCARLARMESSSLATAIVETVNNALASVGRSGNRQDRADGLGPKDEHAVGEAETPTPGSMPTIDQDGGEG